VGKKRQTKLQALAFELSATPLKALQLINSLISWKMLILAFMFYGCWVAKFQWLVVAFAGTTAVIAMFIRDIQKPGSNLAEIFKAFATHWRGKGSDFGGGGDGGGPME
jgi:hypothetical protein